MLHIHVYPVAQNKPNTGPWKSFPPFHKFQSNIGSPACLEREGEYRDINLQSAISPMMPLNLTNLTFSYKKQNTFVKLLVLCFNAVVRFRDAAILEQILQLPATLVKSDQEDHHFLLRKAFGNCSCSQTLSFIKIWWLTLQKLLLHIISMLIQPVSGGAVTSK